MQDNTRLKATVTVWASGGGEASDREAVRSAKAKRVAPNRVERLVDSLDDDEIYALEALLLDRERAAGRKER